MPERLHQEPLPEGFFTPRAFKQEMSTFLAQTKESNTTEIFPAFFLITDEKGKPFVDLMRLEGREIDVNFACAFARNSAGELMLYLYYRHGNELYDANAGVTGSVEDAEKFLAKADSGGFLRMDGGKIRETAEKGLKRSTNTAFGYMQRVKEARDTARETFTKIVTGIRDEAGFETVRNQTLSMLGLAERIPDSGSTTIEKAAYPRIELRREQRILAGTKYSPGESVEKFMVPSLSVIVHLGDHQQFVSEGGPEYIRHWHETIAALTNEIDESEADSDLRRACAERGIQQISLLIEFDKSGLGKGKEGRFAVPLASSIIVEL